MTKVSITSTLIDIESDLSFSNVVIIDGIFEAGVKVADIKNKLVKSGYQVQGVDAIGLDEPLYLVQYDDDYHLNTTITITASIEEGLSA